METRAHYVAVGAFVLALVFLAFTSVLWLAGTQFATPYDHYVIYFKGAVTGLNKGAPVDYNGIPVGEVTDIDLEPGNVERIAVTVKIKQSIPIKEDARASVETNILSGVSFILITHGTQGAKKLTAPDGQYPEIKSHRSTLASLSSRAPQLLEKLDDILDDITDVLKPQNREAFSATLLNVSKTSQAIADHTDDFVAVATTAKQLFVGALTLVTTLNKSLSDPDGQLHATVADFDKLETSLTETSRQAQLTLQDVRPGVRMFSQHTLVDLGGLIGETRQLISSLSRLAGQLERDPARVIFGDRREGYHPK